MSSSLLCSGRCVVVVVVSSSLWCHHRCRVIVVVSALSCCHRQVVLPYFIIVVVALYGKSPYGEINREGRVVAEARKEFE